ncbi:weak neurotoxin 6 isoform X2 [Pimephales promelas]|uniref:weak neurotoxin 6 isoform X2 n=1 Tax=Pimephales promelas TaxID=90988 RepID=UPI00195586DC|nr:weak neurotoxin 6 isoform X2 [Pimephales promelas]
MDLRVSVVLLFVFLNGGYSLKCYSCMPDSTGSCKAKVETCQDGFSICASSKVEQSDGLTKVFITKACADQCKPGTQKIDEGSLSVQCCDTDLCNAADGMVKGSFLLLFSPLLFYFLFQ